MYEALLTVESLQTSPSRRSCSGSERPVAEHAVHDDRLELRRVLADQRIECRDVGAALVVHRGDVLAGVFTFSCPFIFIVSPQTRRQQTGGGPSALPSMSCRTTGTGALHEDARPPAARVRNRQDSSVVCGEPTDGPIRRCRTSVSTPGALSPRLFDRHCDRSGQGFGDFAKDLGGDCGDGQVSSLIEQLVELSRFELIAEFGLQQLQRLICAAGVWWFVATCSDDVDDDVCVTELDECLEDRDDTDPDLVPRACANVSLDGRAHQGEGVVVATVSDVERCQAFAGLVGGQLGVQRRGHVDRPLEEAEGFGGFEVFQRCALCHAGVGDAVRVADLVGELDDVSDAGQMGCGHLWCEVGVGDQPGEPGGFLQPSAQQPEHVDGGLGSPLHIEHVSEHESGPVTASEKVANAGTNGSSAGPRRSSSARARLMSSCERLSRCCMKAKKEAPAATIGRSGWLAAVAIVSTRAAPVGDLHLQSGPRPPQDLADESAGGVAVAEFAGPSEGVANVGPFGRNARCQRSSSGLLSPASARSAQPRKWSRWRRRAATDSPLACRRSFPNWRSVSSSWNRVSLDRGWRPPMTA